MTTANAKIVKHLEDAHAIELALVQTLTAHIGVTPSGEYRDILERHLRETQEQSGRLRERLAELGATKNPVDLVRGVAETVVGQVLAAAKAPIDLLRGPSGEEKLLRNARDEVVTEALEIATYDALEALAEAAGDQKTATLAREHRTQEEVTLKQLREVIPQLARDAYAADVKGSPSYDPAETGAAQATKAAGAAARDAAGRLAGRAGGGDGGGDGGGSGSGADIASLPQNQALKALDGLSGEDLATAEADERAGRNRQVILNRIKRLREEAAGVA